MKHVTRLDEAVQAVCPIHGLSPERDGSVRIDFKAEATPGQRAAAANVVAAFDDSDDAQVAWEEARRPARKSIKTDAAQALSDNAAFLVIPSPSPAQTVAQMKRLTVQVSLIIRRLLEE